MHRIKIDRSFVTRIDQDRGQQDMVAAILSMAERLGLETLAEGVETLGEHAMLAQLGCATVQGFGIAPPMALPTALDWMRRTNAEKIADSHRVGPPRDVIAQDPQPGAKALDLSRPGLLNPA